MKRKVLRIVLKTLVLTSLISTFYFFAFRVPKIKNREELISAKNILIANLTILIQNRLTYIELTHLDPQSAGFDIEKSSLIATIQKTNHKGLANPNFPNEAREILLRQNILLEEVFATKSYDDGVAILKSEEALELLVDQTNLVRKWQQEIRELE